VKKEDKRGTYTVQGLLFVSSLFLTIGFCFLIQSKAGSELENMRGEKMTLQNKLGKLKEKTKKVEGLEEKRRTLKEKLTTIATLKLKKHGPVHVLDDLNSAVPERVWITSVKEKSGGAIEVSGIALDNQTIAQFIKDLEKSDFFQKVEPIVTKQIVFEDVKLKEFTLAAETSTPVKAAAAPAAATASIEANKKNT
jgi:type IV pilus assembly protein PilN